MNNYPKCIYGNPCYAVCINQNCKKFGFICEEGFHTKDQCYLFHQNCRHIKWTQVQQLANKNGYTAIPQFQQFRLQVQKMFINSIAKIKQQQQKFRIWMKAFGHSLQVMKFIKIMSNKEYDLISGSYIAPVINSYFKQDIGRVKPPVFNSQDFKQVSQDISQAIQSITSLYLKTSKRKVKHQQSLINIANTPKNQKQINLTKSVQQNTFNQIRGRNDTSLFNKKQKKIERLEGGSIVSQQQSLNQSRQLVQKFSSKICKNQDNLKKLFTAEKNLKFKLLYRASQNDFSIQKFHKICDNVPNTLTLIQTEFGKIIGGFTPLPWQSQKKQWIADKNNKTFLFSLSLNQKYTLNLAQFAIACNSQKGPTFGCSDISICNNAIKQKSNAQFPISFNVNKKYHRGDQASFAFTGHPKGQFRTKQWQVFQVQFQ